MLLHLSPRFYLCYNDVQVDILDVFIPELNLTLKSGKDITLKTPFKNKRYKVVCRKKGQKAINGIFIETDKRLDNFTVITRWAVDGDISTHKVHFHVMDSEYDAITDYIMLWNGFYNTPYRARNENKSSDWIPAKDQPRMLTYSSDTDSKRDDSIFNVHDEHGVVRSRTEYIEVPTVERERLTAPFFGNDRFPSVEDIFSASVQDFELTLIPNKFSTFGVCVVPLSDWIKEIKLANKENKKRHNVYDVFSDVNEKFFRILDDVNMASQFFYSNTSDLINKARLYSPTYSECKGGDETDVNYLLTQPVFHVFIEEEGDE
ncbi:DUF6012 family protein [Serratia nevei]|uniref:DUF6012 family protein n=1 Tax=Serratia nevei TaxID=2703794 RepID=UPI003F75FDE8